MKDNCILLNQPQKHKEGNNKDVCLIVSKEDDFPTDNSGYSHIIYDKGYFGQESIKTYLKLKGYNNIDAKTEEKAKTPNLFSDHKIAWVFCFTEDYQFYGNALISELSKKSSFDVIPYSVNFDKQGCKRIDVDLSDNTGNFWENLSHKNFNKYYAKYYAAIDSIVSNPEYEHYIFIDVDVIPLKSIDQVAKYCNDEMDCPLFARYYYNYINNWAEYKGKKTEYPYGYELEQILDVKRNSDHILATGLFIYKKEHRSFFQECIDEYNKLKRREIKDFADDNAISEERVTNALFWKHKYMNCLPITWQNKSHNNYGGRYRQFVDFGFDIFYDITSKKELFLHGPDPHIAPKNEQTLNAAINTINYEDKGLIIIAHADDETIFGGNVFHKAYWTIVCVTKPDEERLKELQQVSAKYGNIDRIIILDHEDDINKKINCDKLINQLRKFVDNVPWSKIITHNPVGEYGHPHHRSVFEAVKALNREFYVFCKDPSFKRKDYSPLEYYKSQKEIIDQLKAKNGDWYISNDDSTNYIDNCGISLYKKDLDKTPYVCCLDKKKATYSIKGKKQCFFITSHCDNETKLKELEKCIAALKKFDIDILLYSTVSLPGGITKEVDKYVFNKENPIIDKKIKTLAFWSIVGNDKLVGQQEDYGYAAVFQCKNCFLLADALGYDIVHIINYDAFFTDKFLPEHLERVKESENGVFYKRHGQIINMLFFSVIANKITRSAFQSININDYLKNHDQIAEIYFENVVGKLLKEYGPNDELYSTQYCYQSFFDYFNSESEKSFCTVCCYDERVKQEAERKMFIYFYKIPQPYNVDVYINDKKEHSLTITQRKCLETNYLANDVKSVIVKDDKGNIHFKMKDDYDIHDYPVYFNWTKETHYIENDSDALGDTLAWTPYVHEYSIKNNVNVVYYAKWASLFDDGQYQNVKFIDNKEKNSSLINSCSKKVIMGINIEDDNYTEYSLQEHASRILNLDHKEIRPKINIKDRAPKIEGKYVCIATQSTSQAKYWTKDGWEEVIKYLKNKGYKVVCIDRHESFGIEGHFNFIPDGCINKTGDFDIQERITDLYNCEFFIGLSSGLSWLAWGLGKPVVMISGFTDPKNEFFTPYRVINRDVCNSCWNDPSCKFDRSDWLWCPRNKNFECSKQISAQMVIDKVNMCILDNKEA